MIWWLSHGERWVAVGLNCGINPESLGAQLLKIKTQVSSIWTEGPSLVEGEVIEYY